MTKNEVMMVIDTLRKQGYSDEDILECFYNIFADDKITLKELTDIVNLLGYELTDEFKALPMISKKVAGIVASSWQTIVLKYIDAKGDIQILKCTRELIFLNKHFRKSDLMHRIILIRKQQSKCVLV
ncbi:unknown [Coprobacillus sp. CAG:698]|nr:unknown [Coprobacillus sp. CAG:698]